VRACTLACAIKVGYVSSLFLNESFEFALFFFVGLSQIKNKFFSKIGNFSWRDFDIPLFKRSKNLIFSVTLDEQFPSYIFNNLKTKVGIFRDKLSEFLRTKNSPTVGTTFDCLLEGKFSKI
jgi:hypothetical protein